jgi:hypothetical protein
MEAARAEEQCDAVRYIFESHEGRHRRNARATAPVGCIHSKIHVDKAVKGNLDSLWR